MDAKLSDVRKVSLHWIEGAPTSYFVLSAEVSTFVEASKRLHWRHGINPHVKDRDNTCAKLWRISAAVLEFQGPFWWTVPDLQKNDDPRGARIIGGGKEETLFIDEEYVARCEAEEAEAEARHYRKQEAEARRKYAAQRS